MASQRDLEKEARKLVRRQQNREAQARHRERERGIVARALAATPELTEEQVKAGLGITAEDLERLDEIVKRPSRHSIASLAALKMKAQFTVAQPKVEVGGEVGVQVIVNSLRKAVGEEPQIVGLPAGAVTTVTTASLPVGDEEGEG